MESTGFVVASIVLGVALVLVAAKAHGREVRLEREALGYRVVNFRGRNPKVVEGLWARDRRTYWGSAGPVAALGAASFLWAGRGLFVLSGVVDPSLELMTRVVVAPMVVAFAVAGLRSLVRKGRRHGRSAVVTVGTYFWWGLTALLVLASAALRAIALF